MHTLFALMPQPVLQSGNASWCRVPVNARENPVAKPDDARRVEEYKP